jgi:hypothetical protein
MRVCLPIQSPSCAQSTAFAPFGLPSSRSPSPVFNRFAALPPFTARQPGQGDWLLVPTLEIAQCMTSLLVTQEDGSKAYKTSLDYETISLELPLSWGLSDRVSLEMDLQVQYIWGGFLDGIVESFHKSLGFPNGGRENVDYGRVEIDVETQNGYSLKLDKAALLVSDPVFGAAFSLVRLPALGLTGRVIGALPLGLGGGLAGSDLPQLGAGLYADWRPGPRTSMHMLLAGVLPLECFGWTGTHPCPMAQVRVSALAELARGLFLFVDCNYRSSPIRGYIADDGRDFFHLPNVDLLIGFVRSGSASRSAGRFGALSVREDPVSHNASDVGFLATGGFRWR